MRSYPVRRAMDRRSLLRGATASVALLATSCVTAPTVTRRAFRIGALTSESLAKDGRQPELELDILAGLRNEGLIDGANIKIDWRRSDGDVTTYPTYARELLSLPVDLFITATTSATVAAKEVTSTIPIVMEGAGDPQNASIKLIDSYTHPGGNVTGTAFSNHKEAQKRLELVHEAVPAVRRAIVLGIGASYNQQETMIDELRPVADTLGIRLAVPPMATDAELDAGMALARDGDVLLSIGSTLVYKNVARIVAFAAAHGLPTAFTREADVRMGGLLSYGSNRRELRFGACRFVRRILDGASPAELPVMLATKYDVAVNLTAARALGITSFPSSVMGQATTVIP